MDRGKPIREQQSRHAHLQKIKRLPNITKIKKLNQNFGIVVNERGEFVWSGDHA